MSMTKKDYEAIADALNPLYADGHGYEWGSDSMEDVLVALCATLEELNPKFKADRFRERVYKVAPAPAASSTPKSTRNANGGC